MFCGYCCCVGRCEDEEVVVEERWKLRVAMGGKENDHREAAVQPPPQLDLYEPLLDEKIKASPRNAAMHQAEIGTKVAPIESLDFE